MGAHIVRYTDSMFRHTVISMHSFDTGCTIASRSTNRLIIFDRDQRDTRYNAKKVSFATLAPCNNRPKQYTVRSFSSENIIPKKIYFCCQQGLLRTLVQRFLQLKFVGSIVTGINLRGKQKLYRPIDDKAIDKDKVLCDKS